MLAGASIGVHVVLGLQGSDGIASHGWEQTAVKHPPHAMTNVESTLDRRPSAGGGLISLLMLTLESQATHTTSTGGPA